MYNPKKYLPTDTYEIVDIYRIENNIIGLNSLFNSVGLKVPTITLSWWTAANWGTVEMINRFKTCIINLLAYIPNTFTIAVNTSTSQKYGYIQANELENALDFINTNITSLIDGLMYTGNVSCGETEDI